MSCQTYWIYLISNNQGTFCDILFTISYSCFCNMSVLTRTWNVFWRTGATRSVHREKHRVSPNKVAVYRMHKKYSNILIFLANEVTETNWLFWMNLRNFMGYEYTTRNTPRILTGTESSLKIISKDKFGKHSLIMRVLTSSACSWKIPQS